MFNRAVAGRMLTRHKEAVDVLNTLEILQVNYAGVLSYSDMFVSSPQTLNTHPFIATMGDVKYFSDLISQGAIMVVNYDDGTHTAGGITPTDSSAALPDPAQPLNVDTSSNSMAGPNPVDAFPTTPGNFIKRTLNINGTVTDHHIVDMSLNNIFDTYSISSQSVPRAILGANSWAYFSAWEKLPAHAYETANYLAKRAGVEVVPFGMSLFPQMMSTNGGNFSNFKMPRINGFGRLLASWRYLRTNEYGTLSITECTIGFYVLGTGDDIRMVYNPWGGKYRDNATAKKESSFKTHEAWLMRRDAPTDAFSAKSIPNSTAKKFYPVSGNIYFGASMAGKLSEYSVGDNLTFEGREVGTSEVTMTVAIATGQLLKNDYSEYLSTGYGIWKPFSSADVEAVMKTWDKLDTSGLVYRIENVNVGERSVKEFHAYKEYGKNRARACKPNDFLDLPYNQEYAWKQVENKLGEVRSLAIWMHDATTSDGSDKSFDTVEYTIRGFDSTGVEVTNPVNVFKLRATNSQTNITTEYNYTESGVDSLLDLIGGSRVKDTNGLIAHMAGEPGEGAAVADLNNAYATFRSQDFRVDYVGQFTGFAPHYASLGTQESLTYLIRQVTDYRHFRVQLPKLLSFFSASNVYSSDILLPPKEQ